MFMKLSLDMTSLFSNRAEKCLKHSNCVRLHPVLTSNFITSAVWSYQTCQRNPIRRWWLHWGGLPLLQIGLMTPMGLHSWKAQKIRGKSALLSIDKNDPPEVLFHHSKMCKNYSFIEGWFSHQSCQRTSGSVVWHQIVLALYLSSISVQHNASHSNRTRGKNMHLCWRNAICKQSYQNQIISDKRKLPSLPKWTKKSSLPTCFSHLMLNKDWASRRWMDCGSSSCSGWNWGSW